MATTITNTNLTVTISEQITINDQVRDNVNTLVITDINELATRIMTVPTANEIPIISFATAAAAGTFVIDNVKYVRVTNKDNTNFCRLRVQSTSQAFDIKLDAGKSFLMGNAKESASNAGASFANFVSVYNILAQADTAPVDVEFVVASL